MFLRDNPQFGYSHLFKIIWEKAEDVTFRKVAFVIKPNNNKN